MTKKILVAAAAMAALVAPQLAQAGSSNYDVLVDGQLGTETRTIAVSLDGLNLLSQRGYNLADSRIDRAAKKVCGFVNGSILPATRDYRNCYGSALGGARSDLDGMVAAQRAG